MNRNEISIRLPHETLQKLRDLRDSYPSGRDISSLVNCCLRRCNGVADIEKVTPATRATSESIKVYLDPEWATLEPEHIRAAIEQELKGITPQPMEESP
jgi:hypothetical protein